MIAIIDYGVGNLFSLDSSLKFLNVSTCVTNRAEDLISADKIILPGVGAFADAIEKLGGTGLVDVIKSEARKGKPLLGICLGMQLLFEKSYEYGEHRGLGLIKGHIAPIEEALKEKPDSNGFGLKVPHIGWNRLDVEKDDSIFKYSAAGSHVYYVHSFYAEKCGGNTLASSDYGIRIPGVVRSGSVYGMQFHPEKSGAAGLDLLRAFAEQ